MSNSFDGKVALVTGAASGIGRASALAFARDGAKIVVADLDVAGGEETTRLISDAGGDATFMVLDVAVAEQHREVVAKTVERYGGLDFAHNNAGTDGVNATVEAYPVEVWDRVVAINLSGVFHAMRAEIPAMLARGGGAIVNTSSGMGLLAQAQASAYVATKHGVVGLTKTAALENFRRGIRINALCPGLTDTPMLGRYFAEMDPEQPRRFADALGEQTPAGRLGLAKEMAEVAVWLCSDGASFVTGHALPVDGGLGIQ